MFTLVLSSYLIVVFLPISDLIVHAFPINDNYLISKFASN